MTAIKRAALASATVMLLGSIATRVGGVTEFYQNLRRGDSKDWFGRGLRVPTIEHVTRNKLIVDGSVPLSAKRV
jgi:hypothetical protein